MTRRDDRGDRVTGVRRVVERIAGSGPRSRVAPPGPLPLPRSPSRPSRPSPPEGANNLVIVVLDSCRFDSFLAADATRTAALGTLERRWSYASWTAPSHYNMLMGLLPHGSPTRVFASDYYKRDLARHAERLGIEDMSFQRLLPSLYLPTFLRDVLGYHTSAMVSMPVLNPATPLNVGFDAYELMPIHNDFRAMLERLEFPDDRPSFHLLNVGETHYPYAIPGDEPSDWPRISGLHGVVKHLDAALAAGGGGAAAEFFTDRQLADLRARQVHAARYCDAVIGDLLDAVPPRTWVIVTADHGELFGEGGYFGHGPIAHDKVFEVPFVEGRVR